MLGRVRVRVTLVLVFVSGYSGMLPVAYVVPGGPEIDRGGGNSITPHLGPVHLGPILYFIQNNVLDLGLGLTVPAL